MIISAETIFSELAAIGFSPFEIHVYDQNYYCPQSEWLDDFSDWLFKRTPPFRADAMDCDDYADFARVYATHALAISSFIDNASHTFACAIVKLSPVGLLGVYPTIDSNLHSLNLVRLADKGWVWFEPQNGRSISIVESSNSILNYDREFWVRV